MRPVLTIQRKILLGLLVPAVCLAVLAGFSYSNLLLLEQRISVLGRVDEVKVVIMELRRHGKFFLFYEDRESYEEVERAGKEAVDMLARIRTELLFPEPQAMVDALVAGLAEYESGLDAVRQSAGRDSALLLRLKSDAHRQSMVLEEQILSLSNLVRERIADISKGLRGRLLATVAVIFACALAAVALIRRQVLRPLKTIEDTTRKIAGGDFTPVPLRRTRDEVRVLQEAFNSMVVELKSRQEQLVQSQKLSSIGTLSAGIAHQVNNALNNISLASQFLRSRKTPDAAAAESRALDNIEKETARARDIIRNLLDFSRRAELTIRRTPLRSVADNAVRFASAQLPSGIGISCTIPDNVQLDIDPQRMSEALLNIIMNGIEATVPGEGEIRLYLDGAAPAGTITLVIEDPGSGIAPEDVARIFDPFFTRKEVGQGTGLGLSVTYGIVEECGGGIRVGSRPGGGTRFFLDFPLPAGKAC